MHDVISIGSALVDIFITSNAFHVQETDQGKMLCQEYGDKLEVDSFEVHTGGGGSNTAVGFSRLGLKTALVSELGMDTWADIILQELKAENVDTSLLIREKKEQTGGSVILVLSDGGRTVMVHRGAASMLDPFDIQPAALATSEWIHLSSISGRQATLQQIFSVIKQHSRRFSWNPGKAELELLVSGKLSLDGLTCSSLILNQEEWEQLSTVHSQVFSWAQVVVVTNGASGGAVYQDGHELFAYQPLSVNVVNETGAGDSFAVGFVAGLITGKELQQCVEYGKRNAASVIQQNGAKQGLLNQSELFHE